MKGGIDRTVYDRLVSEAYQVVVQSERVAAGLSVFRAAADRLPSPADDLSIALIPGAFWREYPQHGGGGERLTRAARQLGIRFERVPLPSFCSVTEGAEHISNWLLAYQGPPVVFVALSKGAMDLGAFFSSNAAVRCYSKIRAWVTVSGLLFGTPLIEALKRERIRSFAVRLLFAAKGYRFSELDSLIGGVVDSHLVAKLEALPFPSYHILGFPHYDDLSSSLARRAAKRLMPLGASDGGGILLAEASRYPGLVVPLLGQDHYLHGVSAESLLWGILGVLEESHVGNAVSQTNS